MRGPFVPYDILNPEQSRLQRRNLCVAMESRQTLHVASVRRIVDNFLHDLQKALAGDAGWLHYLRSSSHLKSQSILKLVKQERYANDWHPVVDGLVDSIISTMGYKGSDLRVA